MSEAINDQTKKISIDCGPSGGLLTFDSLDEVQKWHDNERSAWQWLNEACSRETGLGPIWGFVEQSIGQIKKQVDRIRNTAATDPSYPKLIENFLTVTKRLYGDRKFFTAISLEGQFIHNLKDSHGEAIAGYAIPWLSNQGIAPVLSQPTSIKAAIYVDRFQESITSETITSTQSSYRGLVETLTERTNNHINELSQREQELTLKIAAFTEDVGKYNKTAEESFSEATKQLEEYKAKFADSVKNITEAFEKHTALSTPVTYWTKRKQNGWLMAGLSFLMFLGLGYFVFDVFNEKILVGAPEAFSWPHISKALVALTLSLWVLRLVARYFIAQLSLSFDADERAMLIQTYLAIIKDGHSMTPDEKRNIFDSIFRRSFSSLSGDDSLPHIIADVLTKVGRR